VRVRVVLGYHGEIRIEMRKNGGDWFSLPNCSRVGMLSGMFAEQRMKAAGKAAEDDARWHIDRTLKGSKNWRIIHDLVLFDRKSDGWCQIDHLVFGRMGHFLVMETKSAKQGMSLHDESGAWSVWFNGKPKPMNSPIAQNIRHIEVLGDYLKQCEVLPKRLGIALPPSFANWVLVQPGSRVPKEYGGAKLVQRDQFSQELDVFIEKISLGSVLRVMGLDELDRIAQRLEEESRENKRIRNSESRTTPEPHPLPPEPERPAQSGFAHVMSTIVEAVANTPAPAVPKSEVSATPCAKCRGLMTFKEVAYCRYNAAKLGRRYLCRKCQ